MDVAPLDAPAAARGTADPRDLRPAALAVAGLLFAVYPAVRPYGDRTVGGSAEAFASPWWLVSHLAAVAAFILLPLGLSAVWTVATRRDGGHPIRPAVLLTWLGAGLTLPYYGAETFALHALGRRVVATGDAALLTLADDIRMGGVQLTVFGLGLLLVAAGGVLVAIATWRTATLLRWGGLLLATGLVLYLPQFFLPPALRIAHGVLLGVGCVLLASALPSRRR